MESAGRARLTNDRRDVGPLAPVAVLPEHQRRGIGGRLIRRGLDLLREWGEQIVIVLGHPDYYPRFGFCSEKARSLESLPPRRGFRSGLW